MDVTPDTTSMRIKLIFSISLIFILSLDASAQPRTNPKKIKTNGYYVHDATRTTFPDILFGYGLKSVYSFDKKDLDVGVTYEKLSGNKNTTITVYIYPAKDGVEGRLRNEYQNAMQAIANHSKNGLDATQFPVKYTGEKYICNGFKAQTNLNENDLSQLTVYECGTWFLKLRITSGQLDTAGMSELEAEIIKTFDPSRLTALKPLKVKADIYFAKSTATDSTLLGSAMGSALQKVEWAVENIDENERASGFPDLYLYMHIASLMEFVKFDREHNLSKTESAQNYLDALNLLIDSGFIAEFIMDQFGMVMIVPENVVFDFEGYMEWEQANPITLDLHKRFYVIAYRAE